MEDWESFRKYLRKGGRTDKVADRVLSLAEKFERYLMDFSSGNLDQATPADLDHYVTELEQDGTSAKGDLWAVRYYYLYSSNVEMAHYTKLLREKRIIRKPFSLQDFRDVNQEYVRRLGERGIRNVNQMIEAGATHQMRTELASSTGIPLQAIVEFTKLSDLARIPGVKSIRARLYHDAGIGTVEEVARMDAETLRDLVVRYVQETNFDGVPTLPAEARFTIDYAKNLPIVVDFTEDKMMPPDL